MKLHERLRDIRKSYKQTLQQVSATTGVSVQYLSDLERGRSSPPIETLMKLCHFYAISPIDMVTGLEDWGVATPVFLPDALKELIVQNRIDLQTAHELNRISLGGQQPRTPEEWLVLYLQLKIIIEHYLRLSDTKK